MSLFILIPTNLISSSLQFFTEEKTSSLLSPKGSRLLGHAEDLNTEANAALQALLLVSSVSDSNRNETSKRNLSGT